MLTALHGLKCRWAVVLAVVLLASTVSFGQAPSSSVIARTRFIINGNTQISKLRGSLKPGDTVQAVFTIAPNAPPTTVTLVSYVAPNETWNLANMQQQVVYNIASDTFGPGDHTLTITVPNSDFQVDFVLGPVIKHLGIGPDGSTNMTIFYHAQNRFIDGDNGGLSGLRTATAPTASTSKPAMVKTPAQPSSAAATATVKISTATTKTPVTKASTTVKHTTGRAG